MEEVEEILKDNENRTEIKSYVYIDDYNAVEVINTEGAPMHISTQKTVLRAKAVKSERLFTRINDLASTIGMQVNSQKTQMLCINPCTHNDVITHIQHEEETISSTDSLKILGFTWKPL